MEGFNYEDGRLAGRRRGRWTEEEKLYLEEWYGLRDEESLARDLGRSKSSVRKMAHEVFQSASRTGPWTSTEVQRLKRYLGATTPEVIAMILGRRTAEIERQIFELGRIQQSGRWSREEIGELKRIYGTRTDEDLAMIFGRSVESIGRQARRLHLAKDKAFVRKIAGTGASRMPRWSADEIEILREMYPRYANLDIAERLDRSVKSIVSKAHHMGLRKDLVRLREMGRQNVSLRYRLD